MQRRKPGHFIKNSVNSGGSVGGSITLVCEPYSDYDFEMRMVERDNSAPNHGGDISVAAQRFGRLANGWLDLSTGINPVPYSNLELANAAWTSLPTTESLNGLLDAARSAYDLVDSTALCAAPGTQALLQILPEIFVPKGPVAVMSPTYSEHAHLWRVNGHPVIEIEQFEDFDAAAVVVVVNPNNPDGRRHDPTILEAARRKLAALGGLLIIDEAFADVTPEISMTSQAEMDGLLILRSFGKFFGLAGLRLGFAVGQDDMTKRLASQLGPWAVSGPAIEIGTRALRDKNWIDQTRQSLALLRARLDKILLSAGLEIVGGTDLYVLTRTKDAAFLYEKLGCAGVLVRAFEDRPEWLRFGLPGNEAEFERLEKVLQD